MKTKILARTAFGVSLFEAMVDVAKKEDLLKKFGIDSDGNNTDVDFSVVVTVNGIAVPFEEHFEKLVDRAFNKREEAFEEEVFEKAKELVSRSRLEKLEQLISEAEWKIEQELEELMKDNNANPKAP
jgi:sulfur carrier protein ThiS